MESSTRFDRVIYDSIISNIVRIFRIRSNQINVSTQFNIILAHSPEFWLGLKTNGSQFHSQDCGLAFLSLEKIPHSGYFSPEAIVTCLSALTRLQGLRLAFESPRSRPPSPRPPPPLTRTVLPALRGLLFTGVSEYLEDLVARINAPLLCESHIIFFHQLEFNTPQLAQFISRRNEALYGVRVIFSDSHVIVSLPGVFADAVDEFEGQGGFNGLELKISCSQSEWQLSAVAQVCSSLLQAFIPTLECLYIENGSSQARWQDDIQNNQWLELLEPFTAVKDLFLTNEFAPRITPALQDLVGERADEVLPALQRICFHPVPGELGGVVPKEIHQFVGARRLSNHFPIPNLRLSLSTHHPPGTIIRNSHCLAPTVKHQ
jgi:hypothetical protein